MIIFNGVEFAKEKENALKAQLDLLPFNKRPHIAAILFEEDHGSQLYTQLKKEAAERVGIAYDVHRFSLLDDSSTVIRHLQKLNLDSSITGIIIQKPAKRRWQTVVNKVNDSAAFEAWWVGLVSQIAEAKDVDGLHPNTLRAVEQGTWETEHKVLPATVKAVVAILDEVWHTDSILLPKTKPETNVVILGQSRIFGQPLFFELKHQQYHVEMMGTAKLREQIETQAFLRYAHIVISATGRPNLITAELIQGGVVLIDVGEPKGDIDVPSVEHKAAYLTPVPGGVGPVTVISLLENSLRLL